METKSVKGTKTEQNLLKSFAGESQARGRYTMFAKVAAEEGYEQIASIFLLTAEQEFAHAQAFFSNLEGGMLEITAAYPAGKIGTTEENLAAAAAGEREEWRELYNHFADVAAEEGFPKLAALWRNIAKVEAVHEARFVKMLERVSSGTEFHSEEAEKWQCRFCGFVHEGKDAPKKCPVCGKDQAWFEREMNNL